MLFFLCIYFEVCLFLGIEVRMNERKNENVKNKGMSINEMDGRFLIS